MQLHLLVAGILQTARIAFKDGIAVVMVYLNLLIIVIRDITVMAVQQGRTGSHAPKVTSAQALINHSLVRRAFTKMKPPNLSARVVSLAITAKIYLSRTIHNTNAQLGTIVRYRLSLIHNIPVRAVNSTTQRRGLGLATVYHALVDLRATNQGLPHLINYARPGIIADVLRIVQHQILEAMPIFVRRDLIVQKVCTLRKDPRNPYHCYLRKYQCFLKASIKQI